MAQRERNRTLQIQLQELTKVVGRLGKTVGEAEEWKRCLKSAKKEWRVTVRFRNRSLQLSAHVLSR